MIKKSFLIYFLCLIFVSLISPGLSDIVETYTGGQGALEVLPDTTSFRIDDYVYPTGAGMRYAVGSPTDVFINPENLADSVGVIVSAELDGVVKPVYFADYTSSQLTSDILGAWPPPERSDSNKILFTFVAPNYFSDDPNYLEYPIQAAVTGFAFRAASVEGNYVTVKFYDLNGNVIPAANNFLPGGSGSGNLTSVAYVAKDNSSNEVPIIHQVELSVPYPDDPNNYDYWSIGTGNDDSSKNDITIYGAAIDAAIDLTSPTGSEVLIAGNNVDITWDNTYSLSWDPTNSYSDVKIEFSIDGGTTWAEVYPQNTGNTGSYSWKVPDVTSNQCRIRISDALEPMIFETSSDFRIYECTVTDVDGDCLLDMNDFAEIANDWLDCGDPENPSCL
jgi:hypothetical protein